MLAACQRNQEQNAELFVFGTIVEIKLWGATQEQSDRAFAELQQMFNGMHRDWHAWEPGRLTDINQAFAQGQPAEADADIVAMIRRSQEIEQRSGGRFNPAIGGLIRLWGFHTSDYPVIGPPPDQAGIDEILSHRPSSRDIHIDGLQLRSENPYVQLDFGGIAKGYAVDLAIERLRDLGIGSAIVNAGGICVRWGVTGTGHGMWLSGSPAAASSVLWRYATMKPCSPREIMSVSGRTSWSVTRTSWTRAAAGR